MCCDIKVEIIHIYRARWELPHGPRLPAVLLVSLLRLIPAADVLSASGDTLVVSSVLMALRFNGSDDIDQINLIFFPKH